MFSVGQLHGAVRACYEGKLVNSYYSESVIEVCETEL